MKKDSPLALIETEIGGLDISNLCINLRKLCITQSMDATFIKQEHRPCIKSLKQEENLSKYMVLCKTYLLHLLLHFPYWGMLATFKMIK